MNPFLYQMAAQHPAAFRDITVGDNHCTESYATTKVFPLLTP